MKMKKVLVSAAALTGTIAGATAVANADTISVQAGDTVSEIAQKYNTSVDAIQQLNNLDNPDMIFVGQQLKVNNNNEAQSTQASQQTTTTNTQAQNTQASQQTNTNTQAQQAQTSTTSNTDYNSSVSGSDAAAKAWIAARESSNNYNARNGQYVGKYQLSASYLNGDYSPANQERVADQYVSQRYGSWSNAQRFWQANGWY